MPHSIVLRWYSITLLLFMCLAMLVTHGGPSEIKHGVICVPLADPTSPRLRRASHGVICVPLADMVFEPMGSLQAYKELKECKEPSSQQAICPRAHQALLHELVTILEYNKEEVLVELSSLFYTTAASNKKNSRFWTHRNNVTPLLIEKHKKYVPQTLSWQALEHTPTTQGLVTLHHPFFDQTTGQLLSAGTRFVLTPEQEADSNHSVFILSGATKQWTRTAIPQHLCIRQQETNAAQKRQLFVQLLKKWVHSAQTIPYVWGGTSFRPNNGNNLHAPVGGFDCTGLILRAAQMCSIPYFFKNSFTVTKYLQPITQLQGLQEGDVIWVDGHCMVISDLAHNKLIEARGYTGGFGVVQEIELARVFQGISTYKQLFATYKQKKPIRRINKDKTLEETTRSLGLYKLF